MPSGKTHDKIAFISIIPILLISTYCLKFNINESIIFTSMALFSQLMFGPDLDTKSAQYKRWGFFSIIWLPYTKLVGHRSKFSHGIILGPISRCLYLCMTLVILMVIIGFIKCYYFHISYQSIIKESFELTKNTYNVIAESELLKPGVVGIFLGAAIHTLTDKTVSFFKNIL